MGWLLGEQHSAYFWVIGEVRNGLAYSLQENKLVDITLQVDRTGVVTYGRIKAY